MPLQFSVCTEDQANWDKFPLANCKLQKYESQIEMKKSSSSSHTSYWMHNLISLHRTQFIFQVIWFQQQCFLIPFFIFIFFLLFHFMRYSFPSLSITHLHSFYHCEHGGRAYSEIFSKDIQADVEKMLNNTLTIQPQTENTFKIDLTERPPWKVFDGLQCKLHQLSMYPDQMQTDHIEKILTEIHKCIKQHVLSMIQCTKLPEWRQFIFYYYLVSVLFFFNVEQREASLMFNWFLLILRPIE